MKLREYQLRACAEVQRLHSEGTRRVLLVAPTGAGKTVMGAHLVREWVVEIGRAHA